MLASQKLLLKTLKKLSNIVKNEVVKNTTFNTLKAKVYELDKKIRDATGLIHIN